MRGTVLQNVTRVPKLVSQLQNTLPNGVLAVKFPLNFARSSSNNHKFFISPPNHILFEAMNSWLPKLWNEIWYEWLRILWEKSFRSYELLRPLVHVNDSRSWVRASRCYEQLKVMDEMNELRSCVLRPLDYMKNSRLWMAWTTLGHELKAQDAMKRLGLWLIWMTQGCELKDLNFMNNFRLLITWATMVLTLGL